MNYEVIVVDDGSDDETPDRLAVIADPRLRVIRNSPSQGAAAARNLGIRAARGRWVSFLDDETSGRLASSVLTSTPPLSLQWTPRSPTQPERGSTPSAAFSSLSRNRIPQPSPRSCCD